ncbi:MAG: hypothetical protein JSR71_09195 [Proteobacteria bacterium]|nr:hypothetical protein [Pseudomonadota bacterium]
MFDFKLENEEAAIMDITPDIAKQLLSTSPGNRKIRQWHVDILAGSMVRGQWKVTSQGIGIDRNGNLRDAHHRLMAVVKSGVTIRSVVVMGLLPESYEVIDTGIKRNMADLLKENGYVTRILNAAAAIVYGTNRAVPVDQMRPIVESGLHDIAKELVKHCSTTRAYYSSAPVRLAACLTILSGGDKNYVLQQYAALCHLDFKSMSTQAMTLVKQVNDRKVDVHDNKLDTTARGLRIFDIAQKDSDELNVKPQDRDRTKNFVLNTLKINAPIPQQPDPLATGTLIVKTKNRNPRNEKTIIDETEPISADRELKELLNKATPSSNGYVHHSGDRNKHQVTTGKRRVE